MLKRKITILFFMLFFSVSICAHAGLKELMAVGKEQKKMARTLKEETKTYNKVKDAILSKKLEEGMAAEEIRDKYGEPIIEVYDEKRNAYKWLYMPATSSHFEGEKLYLFVSEEEELVGWQLVNAEE